MINQHVVESGVTLTNACHNASYAAGWWPQLPHENPLLFSNKLMLTVSELAEALEGDRKKLPDDHLPQYDMRAVELADAAIRIFDLAGACNYNLGEIIAAKLAYNAHRKDHKLEVRAAAGGKAY